jgi:hypothetical protein
VIRRGGAGGDDPVVEREQFTPLRRVRSWRRVALLVGGPIAWLVAIVIVGITVRRTNAIGLALVLTGATFVVAATGGVLLRASRLRRVRG